MSAPNNPNAFPCTGEGYQSEHYTQYGMTLRDWFAGQMASAALVNATGITEEVANEAFPFVARLSYKMADALLAERAKAGEA